MISSAAGPCVAMGLCAAGSPLKQQHGPKPVGVVNAGEKCEYSSSGQRMEWIGHRYYPKCSGNMEKLAALLVAVPSN